MKLPILDVPKIECPSRRSRRSCCSVPSPIPSSEAGVRLGRHHHQDVGHQEYQRRQHGSLARVRLESAVSSLTDTVVPSQ